MIHVWHEEFKQTVADGNLLDLFKNNTLESVNHNIFTKAAVTKAANRSSKIKHAM